MERQIPIYFNDVSFSSPLEPIANIPTIGKTKVRVFTKYRNRNGSYITDEMADQLPPFHLTSQSLAFLTKKMATLPHMSLKT